MKKLIPLLISLSFLFACGNQESASEKGNQTDTLSLFRNFIKKFPIRQLPISKHLCENAFPEQNLETITETDSIFSGNDSYGRPCWGLLPDTSEYYYVIWTIPADDIIPAFAIFDKKGKKLKEEYIIVGRCDCGGPCYMCNDDFIISKDYSIFSVDTFWTYDCDTLYNILDSTKTQISILYKTGQIKGGNIKMSQEIKRDL